MLGGLLEAKRVETQILKTTAESFSIRDETLQKVPYIRMLYRRLSRLQVAERLIAKPARSGDSVKGQVLVHDISEA